MVDYKMNKNLVSIIIPIFNAEEFTSQMVDSIIAQTYTNWELIIVDDGSTDNSINIINTFVSKDKRIKLIVRPDNIEKGAPSCRNIGINNSNGKYIIFFDADDYIAPYCLEQRVTFLEKHNECDFAIFPMLAFKDNLYDYKNAIWGYKMEDKVLSHFIAGAIPFVVATNIYRKESIIRKQLYWDTNLKSLQDSGYNIMSINKGCKYIFSNLRPDYFYRIRGNANSITKKLNSDLHFHSRMYFYNKLLSLFLEKKEFTSELYILTNIHFKYLCFDENKKHLDKYLSTPFLKERGFLSLRLRFIYHIIKKIKIRSEKVRNRLILIFCPFFELRHKLYHIRHNKHKENVYKELIIKETVHALN